MQRYILTGTPGSGKSTLLRGLELAGHLVVEEAATDVIARAQARGVREPWTEARFLDDIAALQRLRMEHADRVSSPNDIQFHDRSFVCTAALAAYLGYPISPLLARELARIREERTFAPTVFFLRNLGFVAPTEARRISFEEALRFEAMHEAVYLEHGYELLYVEPGTIDGRMQTILNAVAERPVG